MADNKKSVNLLPEYLKTAKNSKFLSSTLDPLIQTPQIERIDGFVGSVETPNYNPETDFYIKETLPLRKEYPLEPAIVFKDSISNVTDVIGFDDIINELSLQGAKTDNLDRLLRSKFYSYDPQVDWDKLVNYNQYYWLPNGPDTIIIDAPVDVENEIIGMASYTMPNGYDLSNGMKIKFSLQTITTASQNKEYYVEGVGSSIKLIDVKLLVVNEAVSTVYNETFDSDLFDSYSFDGSRRLPLTPEYVTINRASDDLNPWTRYNRWFHSDILKTTAEINNKASVVYPLDSRAKRPIIEFKPNIQLYDFGSVGIKNVDIIDTDTIDAFSSVDGTIGYYSDGVLLEQGTRVIFNADNSLSGKIYTVSYDISTNPPILRLVEDTTPDNLNSVEVNFGTTNAGTSWHYTTKHINGVDITQWWKSQQHTSINQAPLFDLYDTSLVSFGDKSLYNSNFKGNKIFGYAVGTVYDKVLGFNIKYKNSVGIGSYVFKNYFMSDVISITDSKNISSTSTTGVTFFKINDGFYNVWELTEDYKTPIIEIQTVSTVTNTLKLTSISTSATSVIATVNGVVTKSTLGNDGITVIINTTTSLAINDVVSLEITSDSVPNSNGFYKVPLGLTNNPLNGPIQEITLSELSDHLSTMVNRSPKFNGDMPGVSNLRDISDYIKYGSRLVTNHNPIAFSQIFLGKKEHNIIDSIRYSADRYNQFKMNMLQHMTTVDTRLSVPDALDAILEKINSGSNSFSPYYRSDMLGYGGNKISRSYTVTSLTNIFPIGVEFDLLTLSFKSVLVYLNGDQLIVDRDYFFNKIDGRIQIFKTLAIGDLIEVQYYPDTLGAYVPPTPTKLGLYPKYEPTKYVSTANTYTGAITLIQGHDGSIIKSYDDYRDDIILEYEKRVYNNIKVTYNSDIFDVRDRLPGLFRDNEYLTSYLTGPYFSSRTVTPRKEGAFDEIAQFNADDSYQGPYDLGFEWNMFGTKFSQLYIGTNGYLTFGGGNSEYTPVQVGVLSHPAIYVEYTDLWEGYGPFGQPLSSGETPGVFYSTGTVGAFKYFRMRFQGSHYIERTNTPTIPTYDYECTLYSDGVNQYVENIYEIIPSTVHGLGPNDIGAVFGIANAGSVGDPGIGITLSPQIVENNSSHVFYSTSEGGNWQYAGKGSFDAFRYQGPVNGYSLNANRYSLSDVNDILAKDFIKWTGQYNIDVNTNNIYDEGNPFSWNYSKSKDILSNNSIPGYWRGVFRYFYDTDRPNTHPWEMLGYSIMPQWWETEYGTAPYKSDNIQLWVDLETGYSRGTDTILSNYIRPGLSGIIPVDTSGNLIELSTFVTGINQTDAKINWVLGDQAPAEMAWRNSSYWPFALNILSALLDPTGYASSMFDTSRTSLNYVNHITYNNLYLNPGNLLLDGDVQAAGYSVYVIEHGNNRNVNYLSSLKQDLAYINSNLFHKLGGFASKDKLQIVIDSVDPLSQASGAILPPEDYSLILNVSNPIKSSSISGVIVQRSGSNFIVKGYDATNPYFEILKPRQSSGSLTVGGKSESFTEWTGTTNNGNSGLSSIDLTSTSANTTHYYKAGQIVRYNGSFYIVKVGHTTQSTFDSTLFQKLPTLPMTGGSTVQLSSGFENTITKIPYGTSFSTIQEVYDLLIGYGAYLERQGFIFDEYKSELENVIDWKFTAKEFLYWTTQNWADGNLITLSPFADYLKYSYSQAVVDNVSKGDYEFSLLKADGKSFPIDKFQLSREDDICTINTIDTLEGIFFATLNSVQKEHAMVFNNSTIFNDTIYDIETGYKQRRVKLSGFRTSNWNGDYFSPGFVYDNVSITDWKPYTNYLPAQVVRYNGSYYQSITKINGDPTFDFAIWTRLNDKPVSNLLPNFDYKINQFEDFYSLDIDNFDATQQELAQHLIGYTPRTYLNNVFTNSISQYKFYQGYIREKGTKNAINKLAKVGKFTRQGSVSFNEDWAFRVGDYGSYSTYNEIEFTLEESTALENPYLIKFVNSKPTDANPLVNYIKSTDLLITPNNYSFANTFPVLSSTFDDNNFLLTNAGYVRTDDVTATAYNKNSLLDIANNSLLQEGNTIWMGFLENGGWGISRYSKQSAKIAGVYISSPGVDITFTTDINHNLSVGDIISIVRFDDQVNGIHIVTAIPKLDQFTVASELTSITNSALLNYGALFKFENARYTNFQEVANSNYISKLKEGEKIWVDNGVDNKWQVYEKVKNYSTNSIIGTLSSPINQYLGQSIYTSDDTNKVLISVPGWTVKNTPGKGGVWVYTKHNITGTLDKRFEFALNTDQSAYCQTGTDNNFGYSLAFDNNKNLYFASAPLASNVVVANSSTTGIVILSTGSGYTKTFVSEGLVKIITADAYLTKENTSVVLVNPYAASSGAASYARFGHSIYINQPESSTSTMLLISAPGDGINNNTTGKVYAYSVNSASTVTAHASGINLNSHVSLNNKSCFGHKIAGDSSGTVVAISAPFHVVTTGTTGVVQLFDNNLTWFQTLTSPFGTSNSFGTDIAVSPDGAYIFVSSVESKVAGEPFGRVAVYKKSGNQFVLSQIIKNPSHYNDLKFGYSISISKDNETLAISALGTNNSELTTFDSTTVFDGGTTQFTNPLLNAGTVYAFTNLDGHFIHSEEIFDSSVIEGSKYGCSIVATNNDIYVGAPTYYETSGTDNSKLHHFSKIDSTVPGSLKLSRTQTDVVDTTTIDRIALIDSFKEEISEYLDIIDPLKGKIAGIADQELKYKSASDPATYSIGLASSIVDSNTSWIDDHIGELWWDLSTVKYTWYEQGDEIFRKNNWGKLFPGSSIDVYEWVKSDLLPSEWAAQADTNDGLTKGISGQPKYPDNSIISIKQIFNNVTNSFENVYFFWVKNKVTVPSVKNRRISGYQVANIIADPTAYGLKFAEILSADSIAFANVQPMLVGNRINANIAIDSTSNDIQKHTEWVLLSEGLENSNPTALLDKKLIDSLVGHDQLGNTVPNPSLTYRTRYGIGIRPQQTLFKDRIEALRNIIEFANSVLIKNKITGNYSFENLNKIDSIPDTFSREYDIVVEDQFALAAIPLTTTIKYSQAELECFVDNGKIVRVDIISPGYGYTIPPKVTIVSDNLFEAEILTVIDSDGQVINTVISSPGAEFQSAPILVVRPHTVVVRTNSDYNGIWTKHQFDYAQTAKENSAVWIKIKNQIYNTPLFWSYSDWISDDYNPYKDYTYVIDNVYELSTLDNVKLNDYIKIKDNGEGRFIILERVSDSVYGDYSKNYNMVFSENGTIQISEAIWNYAKLNYAYDNATLDETLYDQIPDLELFYILQALRYDIFINDLKINWNLLFFTGVKFALTEQKLLDWAFKTSFINVINVIGSLDQRPVYKLDDEKSFEDYIKEVKPYHSQIRTYTSKYSYLEDTADLSTTDFDLPSYYNTETNSFAVVTSVDSFEATQQPWKTWADNYTSEIGSIVIGNAGSGYTQIPTVTITGGGAYVTSTATASAYIRMGGIYQIVVTDPGAGYTENPTITITGGGPYVTSTAIASASLLNLKTRKNTIGIKFDRVNPKSELVNVRVVDTFICSGSVNEFVLTWLANPDKLSIVPTLDGKLILGDDYTIEYYTEKYNGYNKRYSKFVFLNYIPSEYQLFKISYEKSIELYKAVDRIEKFHTSTDTLSSLMEGIVYPGSVIQGLPFNYSVAWDTVSGKAGYDADGSTWSELVNYYATAKIVSDAAIGDTTLYLNTTTGIVPGQIINVLNFPTSRLRADTVVTSVNEIDNYVNISSPFFRIISAKSTATTVGSDIIIKTSDAFNGGLTAGDKINITGITSGGYNNSYTVDQILSSNRFIVKALSTLSTSTAVPTVLSSATVITLVNSINADDIIYDLTQEYAVPSVPGQAFANIYTVDLDVLYDNISKIEIFIVGIALPMHDHPTGAEYYQSTKNSNGKTSILFYQLSNNQISGGINPYKFRFKIYGYPTVEFWKPETSVSGLNLDIPGGSWDSENFVGSQGYIFNETAILSTATDNIIDGDAFLNERSGYAPEELVAGHVLDSLGVNVYTKADYSYANVVTGMIPIVENIQTSEVLTMMPGNFDGVMLHYEGILFTRISGTTFSNQFQYSIEGNIVTIAAQPTSGIANITLVDVGGNRSVIDSNVVVTSSSTAVVESLASINDINMAYVTVDGVEINQNSYELTYVSDTNKRACVKVRGLSASPHTIEAWFFESMYTKFSRMHEELYYIVRTDFSNYSISLSSRPGVIEPVSDQVIVNYNDGIENIRLVPPRTSYYKIKNNQRTFDIDSQSQHPQYTYNTDFVKVYANGVELRPGFDYTLDEVYSNITIAANLLRNGDVIAIESFPAGEQDFIISGNILEIQKAPNSIGTSVTVRVISFTDHDNMMIRTERFTNNPYRTFLLALTVLNENYVWVYVNGRYLIPKYEFEILDDMKTIRLADGVIPSNDSTSIILITSINPLSFGNQVLGYRVFNDMFDRHQFERISSFYSTTLAQPLHTNDTAIYVTDASKLVPPNPLTNKPGVVIIDGERIEFFIKDGNTLRQLRRSTLGTGPALLSHAGTTVIDQSLQQSIPYTESVLVQTTSTNSLTYIINTLTNSVTGDGITLTSGIAAIDQLTVYYGGRQLRKTPLAFHDTSKSYDDTAESITILPPEFSITTSTYELVLNISDISSSDSRLTIVQRKGYIWTGTESLLTSDVIQAHFLREREASLPDIYYYGG